MHFSPSILALAASLVSLPNGPTSAELLPLTDASEASLSVPGDVPDEDTPRIAWPLIQVVDAENLQMRLVPLSRKGARKYLVERRREFAADLKRAEYTPRNRAARRALARQVRLAPI